MRRGPAALPPGSGWLGAAAVSSFAGDVANLLIRLPGARGRVLRRRRPVSLPTLFTPNIGGARSGDEIELPASERSHLRALRLAAGNRVEVTDGRGRRWVAELRDASGLQARCALVEPVPAAPDLSVTLAFGVASKDRTLWLVEKAVELGARGLQPLELARSRSVADAGRSTGFWAKARRRAVAALKQCGGSRLPEIAPVLPLERWLAGLPPVSRQTDPAAHGGRPASREGEPLRLLADLEATRTLFDVASTWRPDRGAFLLVGPEGGLTGQEVEDCRAAGFHGVRLGARTLRFETAAVAGLALLAQLQLSDRVGSAEVER